MTSEMQFSINGELSSHAPDAAFVLQTIEQAAEDEELLFALEDDEAYLEVEGSRAEGFVCFYDNETTGESLQDAEDELDAAKVAVLIELYAQGDPAWRTAIQWETPSPPKPSLTLKGGEKLSRLAGWFLVVVFGSMFLQIVALVAAEFVPREFAPLIADGLSYGVILALLVIYALYLRLFVRELRPQFESFLKAQYAITGQHTIIEAVVWILGSLAPLAVGVAFYLFMFG
jgi:hypothetical protein